MSIIDNRTTRLDLPLPNSSNNMTDDCARLITALQAIDAAMATLTDLSGYTNTTDLNTALGLKANTTDVNTALGLKADATALASKADNSGNSGQVFNVGPATNGAHAMQKQQVEVAISARAGTAGGVSLRNKIIDGRFDWWHEGTTQTTSGYGSDAMWYNENDASTKTHSQQVLTPGVDLPAIEVPSARFFSRTVVTGLENGFVRKVMKLEDGRLLAGKTVTLSFYAKADASKILGLSLHQVSGSGGVGTNVVAKAVSITSSWARYTATFTLSSVAGWTLTSDSALWVAFWFDAAGGNSINTTSAGFLLPKQSGTFDVACVQLEEGTVATPFEELPLGVSRMMTDYYIQYIHVADARPLTTLTGSAARADYLQRASGMRVTPSTLLDTTKTNVFRLVSQAGALKVSASAITITNNLGMVFSVYGTITGYTYAAGDYIFLDLYIISDARL